MERSRITLSAERGFGWRTKQATISRTTGPKPTARSRARSGIDERAVPALTKLLLDDPDEHARIAGARALGAIGDRRAIPALLNVLGDGDDLVRRVRTVWLRTIIEEGLEQLQEPGVALRMWALESLAKLQAKQILPVLAALLKHDDRHQRRHAAQLLAALGDAHGIELLREAEKNEPLWRRKPFRRALEQRERLERTPFEAA